MIEFKLGKTGSGKSYLCVKEIIDFLLGTDCYVVTNMPLVMAELNEYFAREYPGRPVHAVHRVRLLEKEETREFYLHREIGNDLKPVSKQQEKLMQFPDFEGAALKSGKPVVYVIDEAHIYFDSRAWAEVGLTMNYYCSQHEKFKAHIILCTQFLKQVELRLREHAVEFNECINHGMRSFLLWKQPKYFTVVKTYKAPPCPAEHTERYTLDPKIAKCYRTTGGVGIDGKVDARFAKKRKGLPIWTVPIFAVAVIAFLNYVPSWLFNWGANKMAGKTSTEKQAEAFKPTGNVTVTKAVDTGQHKEDEKRADYGTTEMPRNQDRYVTGVIRQGQRFVIVLDDGTVRTDRDNWDAPKPLIQSVARTYVEIEGRRYFVKPHVDNTEKRREFATPQQGAAGTAERRAAAPDAPPPSAEGKK